MSQADIFELLKNKRLSGDSSFFNVRKICKMLKEKGCCDNPRGVTSELRCLRDFGYLDVVVLSDKIKSNGVKFSYCSYRLKKKYC